MLLVFEVIGILFLTNCFLASACGCGNCINLLGANVWQDSLDYGGLPQRAIDGNTDGDYTHLSCSHTTIPGNHWWAVDFAVVSSFTSIRINNRLDCCTSRLNNFDIYISTLATFDPTNPMAGMVVCVSYSTTGTVPGFFNLATGTPCRGRFAMVALHNNNQPLTICEIQFCSNPATAGPMQQLSIVGNPAFQDSEYLPIPGAAGLADDGNTNQNYLGHSCTHTSIGPASHWWVVDLQNLYQVAEVDLFNRVDCCTDRLNNVTIQISSVGTFDPTNPFDGMVTCASYYTTGTVPNKEIINTGTACEGRFLMVYLYNNAQPLTLCEVYAYVY